MSGLTLEVSSLALEVSKRNSIELSLGLSVPIVQNVTGGSGGSKVFTLTFTDASLSVAGILVVTHGLNATPTGLALFDSVGESIYPDKVEILSDSILSITLESFRSLQGTWSLIING